MKRINWATALLPLWILFCGLFANVSAVSAASFNCKQASTKVEKMICAHTDISQIDEELAEIYQHSYQLLSIPERKGLKLQQRDWNTQKNTCTHNWCLRRKYTDRLAELNEHLKKAATKQQALVPVTARQTQYNQAPAIAIRFNRKIDNDNSWQKRLEISAIHSKTDIENEQPLSKDNWIISTDGSQLIYPFMKPDSSYQITIKAGLMPKTGAKLAVDRKFKVTTNRIEPSASFASKGHVLSNQLKKALPVATLNVDKLDVDFIRIDESDYGNTLGRLSESKQRSRDLNQLAQKHPVVYTSRFDIEHKQHQRTITNLDISNISELKQPALYLAVLRIPGVYQQNNFQVATFTVSDIGLEARKHQKQLTVIARSIASGEALSNVQVQLYKGNELLAEAESDESGLTEFKRNDLREANYLVAKQDQQISLLPLNRNQLDLSAFKNFSKRHYPRQVYAWSARELYRSGEKLQVMALLRDVQGSATEALAINAKLIDAGGTQISKVSLKPDESGLYLFDHQLAANAKSGFWRLDLIEPGTNRSLYQFSFQVEDFMPERIALEVGGDQESNLKGRESFSVPVVANYLYGAPAAGNKIDGKVYAALAPHPFLQWPDYKFGLDNENIPNQYRKIPAQKTDEQGRAEIFISSKDWLAVRSPLAITTSVSVYESGGRPVTRSSQFISLPAGNMVGIAPGFDGQANSNESADFNLGLFNHQGELQNGKNYVLSLVREDRDYYWHYSEHSGWRWQYHNDEYQVDSQVLNFNGKVPNKVSLPLQWGSYRLEVFDPSGELVHQYRFSTNWSGWSNHSNAILKPDQVQMTLDKSDYLDGEAALLTIIPPTDGLATITVEDNNQLYSLEYQQVKASGTELRIPITSDMKRRDIFITATVLAPGDMKTAVAPKRAIGRIHLPVARAEQAFQLSVQVPAQVKPNQTLDLAFTSSQQSQQWMTVAAVDVGILNITDFETPDAGKYLFAPERFEQSLYDLYGKIIENAGFQSQVQKFGGDIELMSLRAMRSGGEQAKAQVQIVSLQSGLVAFDAQGKAQVSLDIPDFNGQLRIMALAWDNNSYASLEEHVTVADELVAQLSMPRFLAIGDQSEFTLELTNMLDANKSYKAQMTLSGAITEQTWQNELELDAKKKRVIPFKVGAEQVGDGQLNLVVTDPQGEPVIDKEWRITVRSAHPLLTRQLNQSIKVGSNWQPKPDLSDMLTSSVEAHLTLANKVKLNLGEHAINLLRYPYGCSEQTTSSGYPWLFITPELAEYYRIKTKLTGKFAQEYSNYFREEQVKKAFNRLKERQLSNGGFALWRASGSEVPWLTAYVTEFLLDAKQQGINNHAASLNAGLQRLNQYLRQKQGVKLNRSINEDYYWFATRSYSAYLLAKASQARLSDIRLLVEEMENNPVANYSGLPWAHIGAALQMTGDPKAANKAFKKALNTQYQNGYRGEYGSELRDTALIYQVLILANVDTNELSWEIRDLLTGRTYLSTQERNALFKAEMASFQMSPTDNFDFSLMLSGGREFNYKDAPVYYYPMDAKQLLELEQINSEQDKLFAQLNWQGYAKESPKPFRNKLFIERDYFNDKGEKIDLTEIDSGELIVVRLQAYSDVPAPDALIVDMLPAGLELENQNLRAAVDLSKLSIEGQPLSNWKWAARLQHEEYLDDRYIAAVELDRQSVYVYYLARAVTPGVYQVPAPRVEDMYRPYYQAVGKTPGKLTVAGDH